MTLPALTLRNDVVTLRPIRKKDEKALAAIAFDPDIWRFTVSRIASEQELAAYVEEAVEQVDQGRRCTFVVEDAAGAVAGATALGNYSATDRRVEIGWTWLARAFHGTGINKNAKFLLLSYAFEHLVLERVEFKTDLVNERARHALKAIGAVQEGVLRSHTLMHDGRRRDTVYYSVLRREWPSIKASIFGAFSPLEVLRHPGSAASQRERASDR